jgi:hypothetical protein
VWAYVVSQQILRRGYPSRASLGGRRHFGTAAGYKALFDGKALADRKKLSQKVRATIVHLAAPVTPLRRAR